MKKPTLAITMGDFNGIGPEIVLRSIQTQRVSRICCPLLIGSFEVFSFYARRMRPKPRLAVVESEYVSHDRTCVPVVEVLPGQRPGINPGIQSAAGGRWSGVSIETAVRLCMDGIADGMVTAPVSKYSMLEAGYPYPGQTEMVSALSGGSPATMMLIAGAFRVGLATVHIPVRKISRSLNIRLVTDRLLSIHHSLVSDFNIRRPNIAVLGLNPHAGERGLLGKEEITILEPAIKHLQSKKLHVDGPFPADGFFGMQAHTRYDAVLAMYHDQGLIPLKLTGFHIGVNFSAGLPIVRTSPDHGTAYSIAGKSKANPESMIEAIQLAVRIIHNRKRRRNDRFQ